MILPTKNTCNKQVQKFTNTSYDMLLELYNNTGFFQDLYDALNPAYHVNFNGGLDGWQATAGTGTLLQLGNFAFSAGGDFYKDGLDIEASENGNITLTFEIDTVGTFVGNLEITYEAGTILYTGVVDQVGGIAAINLNLEQEPTHVGKITGLRFILGSSPADIFNIYKVIVGKPLVSINNLSNTEAAILSLQSLLDTLGSDVENQISRISELEQKPTILLNPASLPSEIVKYVPTGLSIEGLNKKVQITDDTIEFRNAGDTSYLTYHMADGIFEYKGRVILPDGTVIQSEDDLGAGGVEGAGDFFEFRFARANEAPSFDNTNSDPSNYFVSPPTGTLPLWMIVGKKNSFGLLLSPWSTPARISGENGPDPIDGIDAKLVKLSTSSQSFTFDGENQLDPAVQTVTFTASRQNITENVVWSAVNQSGTPVILTNLSNTSATLSSANFGSSHRVTVTATAAGFSDVITIVRLTDGTSALSAYLTNESHTVATNSDGSGGDYSNAGGSLKAYLGMTLVTTNITYSIAEATEGLNISINAAGVYTISGLSVNSAVATIRAVYKGIVLDKTYTITKSRAGINGSDPTNAVSVFLTNESYTAPSDQNGANPNLSGAGGQFMLYEGTTLITSNLTFGGGGTKNGLTLSISQSTGVYTISGSSWSTDLEFFDLTVTYSGTTYTKRYTISKAKTGGGGLAGAGFYSMTIAGNAQTGTLLQNTLNNAIQTKAGRSATNSDVLFVTWANVSLAYTFLNGTWGQAALTINGSIVASGTIAGDKLVANALYGKRQLISSNTHVYVVDPDGVELPSNMLVWYGSTSFSASARTKANGIFWIDKAGEYSKDYQKKYSSVNFVYSGTSTTTVTMPNIRGLVEGRITGRLTTFVGGNVGDFPENAKLELRILRNGVFKTQEQLELVKKLDPSGGYLVDGASFQYIIQSPIINFNFFIDPAENTGAFQSNVVYTLEIRILGGNSQLVYSPHFSRFRLTIEENR